MHVQLYVHVYLLLVAVEVFEHKCYSLVTQGCTFHSKTIQLFYFLSP